MVHKLYRKKTTLADRVKQWKQAQKDKTRRQAIVGDAVFSEVLGDLIEYALASKDEVTKELLKSMECSDRARLAYVLGLIPKGIMQDLQRIHNIRNMWAHLEEPEFSTTGMKKNILALSTVGSNRDEVTGENYMEFFFDAVRKSQDALMEAARNISKRPQKENPTQRQPSKPSGKSAEVA